MIRSKNHQNDHTVHLDTNDGVITAQSSSSSDNICGEIQAFFEESQPKLGFPSLLMRDNPNRENQIPHWTQSPAITPISGHPRIEPHQSNIHPLHLYPSSSNFHTRLPIGTGIVAEACLDGAKDFLRAFRSHRARTGGKQWLRENKVKEVIVGITA